eukprot:CAMPEP_0197828214 /NCGR_PEP_ID=MMETSP1437-20131217/4848_1 /TAXON_ID=49252 ORGANISM="Eucampia antarctica, Strain CCMP1452" /NCGR_SAMPLE_ID=MMETSP1437 /ASSEMBLY_ACC=CAM_ASM_001096 /LENGTH=611 /DNA_ID=CAMNT_0043429377 /DNA_START=40 /DNA_END=1875 /DNA_ORIENTATION=+
MDSDEDNGVPIHNMSVQSFAPGKRYRKKKKKKSRSIDDRVSLTHNVGIFMIIGVFVMFAFGLVQSIRSIPDSEVTNPAYMYGDNTNTNNGSNGNNNNNNKGGEGGYHVGGEIILSRNGIVPVPSDHHEQRLMEAAVTAVTAIPVEDDDEDEDEDEDDEIRAPQSFWPVIMEKDDEDEWEDIVHPGNPEVTMTVPQFWSDPLHDKKLMTRDLAMQIGTCITADADGNLQRGDECDVQDRTIFVAIASYRDFQCRTTVESIFNRAKYPARVRVAIVDQIVPQEDAKCNAPIEPCTSSTDTDAHNQALCLYKDQVHVYEMDASLALGPVFARHIGHRLYRGEYYAMQSDAHVTFTQDWDEDIIQQHENSRDEMAVQSTYLTDITNSIDELTGQSKRHTRPIMCNTDYEGGIQGKHLRHLSQPEGVPTITNSPQLEPYWAAGFSFARGHFVVNVPYDLYQPMIFQGEEMSIGIRGFTVGYDYFATERSICFHHYAVGPNAKKRGKVKHFWDNENLYRGTGIKAMKRLLGIVNMNPEVPRSTWDHSEEERYGLGGVRTTQKFYETFGIDVVNKVTEHNLCKFVNGQMHNMFIKHLRSDGMGVDYDKIDYKFKNPDK